MRFYLIFLFRYAVWRTSVKSTEENTWNKERKNEEEECIMRRLITFALHQTVMIIK
jgi:hypothetical protein